MRRLVSPLRPRLRSSTRRILDPAAPGPGFTGQLSVGGFARSPRIPPTTDAVHAVSPSAGQGASLAIEDALVVAKCLRDIPDTGRAFAVYERLRRERAEKVVAYSRRIGTTKTAGPVARRFRDLIMPFALKHFVNPDSYAWLYRCRIDWEQKVAA